LQFRELETRAILHPDSSYKLLNLVMIPVRWKIRNLTSAAMERAEIERSNASAAVIASRHRRRLQTRCGDG